MLAALDVAGNPSSVHAEGRRARAIIEAAREKVARLVGAKPSRGRVHQRRDGSQQLGAWRGRLGDDLRQRRSSTIRCLRRPAPRGAKVVALPVGARRRRRCCRPLRDALRCSAATAPRAADACMTGQQRDRRHPACRRGGRAGARARRCRAYRCRAGGRPHADRFRRRSAPTRWRFRPQARRPERASARWSFATRKSPAASSRAAARSGAGAAAPRTSPASPASARRPRRSRAKQDAAQRMAALRDQLEAGVLRITPARRDRRRKARAPRQHDVHRAARQARPRRS